MFRHWLAPVTTCCLVCPSVCLSRLCVCFSWQKAASNIRFAPHLVQMAARFVEWQLGRKVEAPAKGPGKSLFQAPYVAIQWRTEYTGQMRTPNTMPRCAQGLVNFTLPMLKVRCVTGALLSL